MYITIKESLINDIRYLNNSHIFFFFYLLMINATIYETRHYNTHTYY